MAKKTYPSKEIKQVLKDIQKQFSALVLAADEIDEREIPDCPLKTIIKSMKEFGMLSENVALGLEEKGEHRVCIVPTKEERRAWKQYLYNMNMFLATERPEFRPRKADSLDTLVESYLSWADNYNDGYFSERDDADKDRFCAWLVQEYDFEYDYEKYSKDFAYLD